MLNLQSDSIPNFFKDRSVFVTGCTGYIGKLVVEKLLRSCPDVKTVYILIREKKSMTAPERIEKLKNDIIFRLLREQNPKALDKIVAIPGDITEVGLGIRDEDKKLLIKNVTVVYHLAASVRFDDFLDTAIITNVRSTRDVIELAYELDKVDSFVYVGTAYSNCDQDEIDEVFYPPKLDWREAIKMAESPDQKFRETIKVLTDLTIKPMPNTYVFTKGVAEAVVKDLCSDRFPTCIVRPSVVAPSIEDPFPGYVDNFNGTIQIFLAVAYGIAKVIHVHPDVVGDHVYVDNVAKSTIIASWQIAKEKQNGVKIYNATSDWSFNLPDSTDIGKEVMKTNPVKFYLGPVSALSTNCVYGYYLFNILFHLIPGLFIDLILKLVGLKLSVLRLRRKFVIANQAFLPFLTHTWTFGNKNYAQLDDVLVESDRNDFSFAHTRQKKGLHEAQKLMRKNLELFIGKCRCLLIPNEREQATKAEIKLYNRVVLADKIIKNSLWAILLYITCWRYNLHWTITNKFVNYIESL